MTDDPKPVPPILPGIETLGPHEFVARIVRNDSGHGAVMVMCGPALTDKIEAVAGLSAESPNDTVSRIFGSGLQLLEAAAVAANTPAEGEELH